MTVKRKETNALRRKMYGILMCSKHAVTTEV